jgi:hypothetical protein
MMHDDGPHEANINYGLKSLDAIYMNWVPNFLIKFYYYYYYYYYWSMFVLYNSVHSTVHI